MSFDRAGNVWLMKSHVGKGNRFQIWRNGQIVEQPDFPGADTVHGLFSDKPNSIYAWSAIGLHHLVANPSADNYRFTLRQTYALPALPSPLLNPRYSELGYVVASISTGPSRRMYLIHLPRE